MKKYNHYKVFGSAVLVLAAFGLHADANRQEWRQIQPIEVSVPGLIKAQLPAETLGALRPDAADLRLLDPVGAEVGWLLERPLRFTPDAPVRQAKAFQSNLKPRATVLLLETGTTLPIAGLGLETGTGSFLKPARVEGSDDGQSWQLVADGLPVYQRYQGETHLQLTFPPHRWARMRVTLDDARTEPVLFTGARLQVVPSGSQMGIEHKSVRIVSREELPGESRLVLDIGSANLDLAALLIASSEGLFTRPASLRVRSVDHGNLVEHTVARGLLFRGFSTNDQPTAANTRFEVGESVPNREAVLAIQNGDSPPLPVSAIEMELLPVQLVFWARQVGRFELLAGNAECVAPRYDLSTFADQIRTATPQTATFGPLAANPTFRLTTVVPDPFAMGAALDVSAWRFRRPLKISRDGAQQLELDLAILAGARADLADVRLVSEGRQRPFVREGGAGWRSVSVEPVPDNDRKNPEVSRWRLKLPYERLPVVSLSMDSTGALFDREVVVSETGMDSRGEIFRQILGETRWRRTPGVPLRPLTIPLASRPSTDTLWIEVRNGDNQPLQLGTVVFSYWATSLHFLAPVSPTTWIYYGNSKATGPEYDLQLVAARLLVADTATATAGAVEGSVQGTWNGIKLSGLGIWFFWGALAVVVAVLLVVLRRLLPESVPPK